MFVIFSIDNQDNPFALNVFKNYLAELPVNSAKQLIGSYKGARELAWIVSETTFNMYIRDTVWIRNQESVLWMTACNKKYCWLEYLGEDGRTEHLGSMHEVSKEEAEAADAYSYRPDLNKYWVAKEGNPDRIPTAQPHMEAPVSNSCTYRMKEPDYVMITDEEKARAFLMAECTEMGFTPAFRPGIDCLMVGETDWDVYSLAEVDEIFDKIVAW